MDKESIYQTWAPEGVIWSPWVKPVLFSQMNAVVENSIEASELNTRAGWHIDYDRSVALVADLPDVLGVELTLNLAAVGYRSIPLYNACPAPAGEMPVVNVRPIMSALAIVAATLKKLNLPSDAPPAFLLDAQRNSNTAEPGKFDNRSISLPTDFPSATFLMAHGIKKVVVIQASDSLPQADLSHTLRRWQDAGLPIFVLGEGSADGPRPITIERPKAYKLLWYNLLALIGLKASPLGGFGGRLPMPSSG